MKRSICTVGILLALAAGISSGQYIEVIPSHEIYAFLKRMEARHLLADYRDAAKPLSRMVLAQYLKNLEPRVNEMTRVERETYEFLVTEFKYELLKIAGDPEPTEERWHIYSHDLTQGILNLDLDYNLARQYTDGHPATDRSQGVKMYGYAFNSVGFYFNYVDNLEKGYNINYGRLNDDGLKNFFPVSSPDYYYYQHIKGPQQGAIISQVNNPTEFQFDQIDAQFSYQTGAFAFSLEKMNNVWGYGRNGTVILSDHAPSYPQLKLRIQIAKDIDFVYFHGELNSNVVDSSQSYTVTYANPAYGKFREIDHPKYIAAHQLEISLWHGVDFSIGESIVYSDKGPLFLYLIPVMFFKAGEHYNQDKDNSQIFGSLDLTCVKNVDAYFSLYIDELNTDKLFDPDYSHRQIAFTSGIKVFDLPLQNCDMTLEYSRVNPAAYNHAYPSTTFTNDGFIMGSWMGQNADDLSLEFGITPMHALRLTAFGEIFRKGGDLPIADQYANDQGRKPFLFGPLHEERSVGVTAQYQPLRDLFLNFKARLRKISDEADPSQNRAHEKEFSIGVGLGIW